MSGKCECVCVCVCRSEVHGGIAGPAKPPTGESFEASFRVRVVRASLRGEAAWAYEAMCPSTLEARMQNVCAAGWAYSIDLGLLWGLVQENGGVGLGVGFAFGP